MGMVSIDFFDGLPPELITFVVCFIPAWQRAALRCTNKRICEIVDGMPNQRKSFLTHQSFALPFSTPDYLRWLEDTCSGKVDWKKVSAFVGRYFPQPFDTYTEAYRLLLDLQETANGVSQSGDCVVLIFYLQDGGVGRNDCLCHAAFAGQLEAMRLAVEMGAIDFNRAIKFAAECGKLEAMHLLVEMGATKFNGALIWAAMKGQLDAMRLAVEMGATHFNEPLGWAAQGGHLEAMRLAVEMGATNFNLALRWAAKSGQLEAMRLAVKMGATAFNDALWDVIFRDHSEAFAYMQKLIAERD
jgi:hypothetical protein